MLTEVSWVKLDNIPNIDISVILFYPKSITTDWRLLKLDISIKLDNIFSLKSRLSEVTFSNCDNTYNGEISDN